MAVARATGIHDASTLGKAGPAWSSLALKAKPAPAHARLAREPYLWLLCRGV